jgi:competence ComEA-like helix-hairpin-helix protein
LPDGPGKEQTEKICSQCHELARSFSLRQDRDGWSATINKMIGLGAQGTDKDFALVLDYLSTNFPGEAVPKLNVNKATAIEFEAALTLRRSQSAAIIKYRNEHGPFKSVADLEKVPGIDAAQIEAKKDRLLFQ